jgi:hypothetical protein
MLEILAKLWNFLGSPQFGPLVTIVQLTIVPIMWMMFRRLAIVYENIMSIPAIKSDVRKLFVLTNAMKRDIRRIEGATQLRHAENLAAMNEAPAE